MVRVREGDDDRAWSVVSEFVLGFEEFRSSICELLSSLEEVLAFIADLLQELDHSLRVSEELGDSFPGSIEAMPANCGEDIRGDPALKLFGLREVGGEDEGVEAGLVDKSESTGRDFKGRVLRPLSKINGFEHHSVLRVNVTDDIPDRMGVAEFFSYVASNEPWLTVSRNCS